MNDPILIVGGGLGALTTALALARRGRRSRVLEGAPEFAWLYDGFPLPTEREQGRIVRAWVARIKRSDGRGVSEADDGEGEAWAIRSTPDRVQSDNYRTGTAEYDRVK